MCALGKITCAAPGVKVRSQGVQLDGFEARQRWVPAAVAKNPSVTTGDTDVRISPTISPLELIPNGVMFPSSRSTVAAGSSKLVKLPCGLNTNPWLQMSLRPFRGFMQGIE